MATRIVNNFIESATPFIFTVNTSHAASGTYATANNQMGIVFSAGWNHDFTIDWGDGTIENYKFATNQHIVHTYPSTGTYQIKMVGAIPTFGLGGRIPDFNSDGDARKLISIDAFGNRASFGIFHIGYGKDYGVINIAQDNPRFYKSTNFALSAFGYNRRLVAMPFFDTSHVNSFRSFLDGCNSLTSVPAYDYTNGVDFRTAFRGCPLTTFRANAFNNCLATDYDGAWSGCALNQQSVDNILVSINTSAQANNLNNGTLGVNGGTNATPSATGQAATDALRAKGWTVSLNGY